MRRYLVLWHGFGACWTVNGRLSLVRTTIRPGTGGSGLRGATLFKSIGAARHAISTTMDRMRRPDGSLTVSVDDFHICAVTVRPQHGQR